MLSNTTRLQESELEDLQELFDILGVEANGEDFLTGEIPLEVSERFAVNDIDTLNWTLRKMSALQAKQAEINALRDAELKRINEWAEKENKSINASLLFFDALVAKYAETRRTEDEKYKGDSTPYGKIKFTKQQPEWKYPNEEETVAFLEQDEELAVHVKTTKAISNKTQIKKVLEIKRNALVKDGQVIDLAQPTDNGWAGMQYAVVKKENEVTQWLEIIDTETGEMVKDVEFAETVVVAGGINVVPGVTVFDRPEKITVEAK